MNRQSRFAVPDHGSFALVGDSNSLNLVRGKTRFG